MAKKSKKKSVVSRAVHGEEGGQVRHKDDEASGQKNDAWEKEGKKEIFPIMPTPSPIGAAQRVEGYEIRAAIASQRKMPDANYNRGEALK